MAPVPNDMNLFHDLLDAAEEQRLISRIHSGDQNAQETLLYHNEKLIYKIAGKYIDSSAADVEIEDLMQAGRMGLLHAAKKWDVAIAKKRQVNKFSTYASWWIHQYIRRYACRHRSGFSRSVLLDDMSYVINRAKNKLLETLQREPTIMEIHEYTKIETAQIKAVIETPEIVRIDENEKLTTNERYEIFRDPNVNVEETSETSVMAQMYITKLEQENQNYARVMRLLYGFTKDGKSYSQTDISKRLNISRERVRQIVERSLEIMRS